MEKFEYKFISVELKGGFLSGKPKMDYRAVIEQQGQEGWRFVQAFAPSVGYGGTSAGVDLIFERKKS